MCNSVYIATTYYSGSKLHSIIIYSMQDYSHSRREAYNEHLTVWNLMIMGSSTIFYTKVTCNPILLFT